MGPAEARSQPRRILVIDDQLEVRRAIASILSAKGFAVVTAETGAEGLREFGKSEFDLAIVDSFLCDGLLDGPDLIQLLRNEKPALPIIAISGRDELELDAQVGGLPGVLPLRKPFRAHELYDAINQATAQT